MENVKITPAAADFTPVRTEVEDTLIDGEKAVRIVKEKGFLVPDSNSYAELKGLHFHNGRLTFRLRSRILPDAPKDARGFIGIVFRVNDIGSEFESFYVRPTNGRGCTDPVRKKHGCQYFSFPGYTFQYFRDFGIEEFEAPVNLALDEWVTITAVIHENTAAFYLNEETSPVLTVPALKHGDSNGAVGIYVDNGTEAFVTDIMIEND